jgi:hypothetical protein
MRQRVRDVAISGDLFDEQNKPVLKTKHAAVCRFTDKDGTRTTAVAIQNPRR